MPHENLKGQRAKRLVAAYPVKRRFIEVEETKEKLRKTPGNDVAQRAAIAEVNVDCAIQIAEKLVGLTRFDSPALT